MYFLDKEAQKSIRTGGTGVSTDQTSTRSPVDEKKDQEKTLSCIDPLSKILKLIREAIVIGRMRLPG